VFLKQNDHLISIYYLKMTKNKTDKTNGCVFGSNTCRKNEPEACFYLFPRCGVKAKYVFIENVFSSKDRVEKKKTRVIHILKLFILGDYSRHLFVECRHNPKFSYLVSTTLVTPHKINNFAHNTFSPSTTHPLSAVASNKLKFCITLKKAITKTTNSCKTNNLF
jgi:hypothetical protein